LPQALCFCRLRTTFSHQSVFFLLGYEWKEKQAYVEGGISKTIEIYLQNQWFNLLEGEQQQ
jgi:hypothetical protein